MADTETWRSKPDYVAGCEECGDRWFARNAVGVAAQHARRYGHQTFVNVAYTMSFRPVGSTAASA